MAKSKKPCKLLPEPRRCWCDCPKRVQYKTVKARAIRLPIRPRKATATKED